MLGLRILIASLLACLGTVPSASAQAVGDCVALEFVRSGCPNCQAMDRAVDESLNGGWAVRRIEVTADPFTTQRWRIHSTPTTLLVRDGREVDRILGPVSFDELQRRMMAASTRIATNPGVVATAASFSLQPINKRSVPSAPSPSIKNLPHTFELAQRATVRIRVDEPTSQAVGTGTIIHSYQEDALVITCGHLFRGLDPNAKIYIELFDRGQEIAYPAQLIHYEAAEKDIGLISFRPGRTVACAPIAHAKRIAEGDSVFSLGCDHGADPSRRDAHITKLNRYLGPPNIEVAGMPVQGRSGGGLFSETGELIGVCYAADQELNEGLYTGLEIIHEQIAKLGIAPLVQPSNTIAQGTREQQSQSILVLVRDSDGSQREMQIHDPSPALLQALAKEGFAIAR
jgi:hypothetical protein